MNITGALNTHYMQCVFIHTRRRRVLSRRKSHQEIPKMDKYPAMLYETISSIENILPYYVIKKSL